MDEKYPTSNVSRILQAQHMNVWKMFVKLMNLAMWLWLYGEIVDILGSALIDRGVQHYTPPQIYPFTVGGWGIENINIANSRWQKFIKLK